MSLNWKSLLPYIIPTLILLVAVHNSPQVQNFLYHTEDYNPYITLQNTDKVYLSNSINIKYLNINAFQPDTLKEFNFPNYIRYGEQSTFALIIDGTEGSRKIKIFLTDSNNIIRFADDRTASYINTNQNNESEFEISSHQINLNKKILINLNIPESNSEIIGGNWNFNIIILKENGETSLFISKPIEIRSKESNILVSAMIFIFFVAVINFFRHNFLSSQL